MKRFLRMNARRHVAAEASKGNRSRGVFRPFTTGEYRTDTMCRQMPTIETFF
jgi:hypothetical protein